MLIQAIMVGIIGGLGILDSRIWGDNMLGRPIIIGPLVGLVLGDLHTGIVIGGTLELIFIGAIQVGASSTGDVITAAAVGTSFAILSHKGAPVALALAIPISLLADRLGDLARIINTPFIHKADKYAEEADIKGIERMHRIPYIVFFLNGFLPSFIMVLLGSSLVNSMIKVLPQWILEGLSTGANMLPAVGFALLMGLMINKKLAPFYFLGFVLAAYFKVDIIGISIIGVIIVLVMLQGSKGSQEGGYFNEQ